MSQTKKYRGRMAPTPSGFLHIGHAQTFRTAWLRARERGGKIVLRMEDIDRARCRTGYADAAAEDLKSLGLDWDEGYGVGGPFAPYSQSGRFGYYWGLVKKLSEKGLVYPSDVSRSLAASLAKFPDKKSAFAEPEKIFPASLRSEPKRTDEIANPERSNWRFRVPCGENISFFDNNFGLVSFRSGEDFGDFSVWRKCGEPSYELAVVADDAAMEITEVVRGKDLLLSTARQILLYRALGFKIPEFFHCPLAVGEDGTKISKSALDGKSSKWLIRNAGDDFRRAFKSTLSIPQGAKPPKANGGSRAV